jgi:hypothetical protein
MKTSQSRQQEIRRERVEALIEGRIGALFSRIPELCGFSVRHDLQPVEVALHSWPGYTPGEDLYVEIVSALAGLVEERAEIAERLRGRTFARQLQ